MNNIITKEMIILDKALHCKDEVISVLAATMNAAGRLNNMDEYISAVKDREATFPTSVGFYVAIPHGKSDAVKSSALAFLRLKEMVDWSDEEKVKYVFLIAVPSRNNGNEHLKILASLSRQLIHEEFRKKLVTLQDASELMTIIEEM